MCWPLSSKRKDSEPGTKSLLSNAEMMAHHPTDPVEMRRINFQTPGMNLSPTQAPERAQRRPSDYSLFANEIFMWLIISGVR